MESRVSTKGIAVLILQWEPQHKRIWLLVDSWGRRLETMEAQESRVILELKALREGAWRLAEYTAYHKNLAFMVSKELRALLKIAHKAHPEIHAYLINLQMYQPTWMVDAKSVTPKELEFTINEEFPTPE